VINLGKGKILIMASRRVLVIAAHPDDEILGCGGTIALHTRSGHNVTSVIVCEGESLRYGKSGVGQNIHTQKAAKTLGVIDVRLLNFPDQKLDTFTLTEVITPLEEIVREIKPDIVYCQYGDDINVDHQLLFKALLVATRPIEKSIEAIYAFDTASSTEWAYPRTFAPDTWVDISKVLDIKLAALSNYKSEMRPYPHPRSIKALRYRANAWGNIVCVEAAEVFMTIRSIFRYGQTPLGLIKVNKK